MLLNRSSPPFFCQIIFERFQWTILGLWKSVNSFPFVPFQTSLNWNKFQTNHVRQFREIILSKVIILLLPLLRVFMLFELQIGFLSFEASGTEHNMTNGVSMLLPMHFWVHYCLYWHLTGEYPLWARRFIYIFQMQVSKRSVRLEMNMFSFFVFLLQQETVFLASLIQTKHKDNTTTAMAVYHCLGTAGFIVILLKGN